MRWLGVAILIAVGVAVFAARSVKLPRSAEPSVSEATPAAVVVATPKPTAGRSEPASAPPTVRAGHPAAAATVPTRVPGARATSRPVGTATPMGATTGTQGTSGSTGTPGTSGITGTIGTAVVTVTPVPTPIAAAAPGVRGEVVLTFDAGADRGYAEDILDILQEQRVPASFGITGLWARANPDLVRRMAADGHMVFNHTLDHRSFTGVSDRLGGLSAARRRAELDDADAIIAPLLGHTTRPWYRLPYGDDDAQAAADLASDGYSRKLGWTVDSLGWRGSASAEILARCVKLAAPGAIYVFHVGRASQDALVLPQIIQRLRDAGYGFRRADQT
jgi:peptidoglycan/xylan/chitin deacetylase (PgdA/CDA1 family)